MDSFKEVILNAFTLLEKIVHICFSIVVNSFEIPVEALLNECGDPPPLLSPSSFSLPPSSSLSSTSPSPSPSPSSSSFAEPSIPPPPAFSSSPFDLFHYFNTPQSTQPNCYEHVDPGMVTCVPCAAMPGLCIVDSCTSEWISIEEYQPTPSFIYFIWLLLYTYTHLGMLPYLQRVPCSIFQEVSSTCYITFVLFDNENTNFRRPCTKSKKTTPRGYRLCTSCALDLDLMLIALLLSYQV